MVVGCFHCLRDDLGSFGHSGWCLRSPVWQCGRPGGAHLTYLDSPTAQYIFFVNQNTYSNHYNPFGHCFWLQIAKLTISVVQREP